MRPARSTWWCFFLSLLGLGLSGYLTFLHLGLMRGELLGGPACGTGTFNCHAVTSGAWGSLMGMPLSLWGTLGYLAVLALSLLGSQSDEWVGHALKLIVLLATLFVGIDVALFAVMVFVIRFYCVFCVLTYAVNLALLIVSVRTLGQPWPVALQQVGTALGTIIPSRQRPAVVLFWGLLIVGGLGILGVHAATTFVSLGTFGSIRKQIREFVSKQPRMSVDVTGNPMKGQPNAPLQIVEFSDFLCPACQRASKMNTIILASHRHDAAFIFKNYPLDTTCNDKVSRMVHAGACRVAAASACANLQGKFWAFHDMIFEKGPSYNPMRLEDDAERIGLDVPRFRACLDGAEGLDAVKRDITEGGRVGVSSTPTYVINGIPVPGGLNPTMFEEVAAVIRESPQ